MAKKKKKRAKKQEGRVLVVRNNETGHYHVRRWTLQTYSESDPFCLRWHRLTYLYKARPAKRKEIDAYLDEIETKVLSLAQVEAELKALQERFEIALRLRPRPGE
jgi:hypothetical protein